jgi:hypothetical protein
MAAFGTSENYGGRIIDNSQGVKQFFVGSQGAINWVYKRISTGINVITISESKNPIYINNDLIVKKDLYVDGSIYNPSDAKLKENIEYITTDQLDNLFKLNPISFSYKSDKDHLKHFGLLAQDVEKLFPELVKENNNYRSVNYQELLPVMLAKMKLMQSEIDELKQHLQK